MTIRAKRIALGAAALALAAAAGLSARAQAPARVDLILKNGRIVDGSGNPWFRGDVAVAGGRIVAVGRIGGLAADRVIDADGLVVVPGFIDLMGQTASVLLSGEQAGLNMLSQGITTINAGEGGTDAPLDDARAERRGAAWRTMREFLAHLEKMGIPLNVAQTVGHTQVRSIVIGEEDRRATPGEMERMKALVRESMEGGAVGLSTALIYPPAVYAPEEEIVELAKVVGEYGGRYFTHMRNEGDRLLEAIDEAVRIGKQARTPVHIFHLKTAGQANWPKMDQALAAIAAARAAGLEITADVYPYVNNGLGLRALIHPRHSARGPEDLVKRLQDPAIRLEIRREMEEGTGWENWYANAGHDWNRIVISQITTPAYASYGGRPLGEIARAVGRDPWDVFFTIVAGPRNGGYAMPQSMSEANKIKAMRQPFVGFCTDVGPLRAPERASHPRGYGSFPRVLARYVNDFGALTLEDAIRKLSSLAANVIMAHDRGRIAEGLAADLVVFDPARIRDRATFAEPALLSEGIDYVIVNGVTVLEKGKLTGAKPGRVLRGPGSVEKSALGR